jgi:transposase
MNVCHMPFPSAAPTWRWSASYDASEGGIHGISSDRAVSAISSALRSAAAMVNALDRRGDHLRAAVRLPMAAPARQLSALGHCLRMRWRGAILKQSRQRHPFVEQAFADSAYNSPRVADATSIEIVRKFADQTGFAVHLRRWVVERTFAWINRNRRLAKDFERSIRSATAFLYAAAALVLVRRFARYA